jgi:hypothetical protein
MALDVSEAAIIERLDTLIRLQAALAMQSMGTQKAKIVFLHGAGIKPRDIAGLLGTTPNTVNVALANHKKAKKAGSAE